MHIVSKGGERRTTLNTAERRHVREVLDMLEVLTKLTESSDKALALLREAAKEE